jgi:hypothetical protein
MAETPSELKEQVDQARARLEQDLNSLHYRVSSLQNRVRDSLDWRTQYRRYTWAFLGAAFASALMLGVAFSRMLAGLRRRT